MMTSASASDSTREQILDAANIRFGQYGYNKTTMAEIAKDCGMSAANLYRFFASKQDIGAALAQRCLSMAECFIREASENKTHSAAQALEAFVLAILRYTHEQWSIQPRLTELVQTIVEERADIMQHHLQIKQALLSEILQRGHDSGEFEIKDATDTAEAILHSLAYYSMPLFMHLRPLADFERMAHNLVKLLLQGLRRR